MDDYEKMEILKVKLIDMVSTTDTVTDKIEIFLKKNGLDLDRMLQFLNIYNSYFEQFIQILNDLEKE